MVDTIDLMGEREKRALDRAFAHAFILTVPAGEIPEAEPMRAPGYTVVVLDHQDTECFRMPCVDTAADGAAVMGLFPGAAERPFVVAALREAVAFAGGGRKRLTIPDVLDRFIAYRKSHPVWGSLHCVLEDGNLEDRDVKDAAAYARERGDREGEILACILLTMSKTQRRKISWRAC